jgi:outer membrane murein-binding lipoprotein Lpp
MNNSAVHQSLIDLQGNLTKLESARNQVNRVSENSEKLISTVAELVRNIEALQDEFISEKSSLADRVNNSLLVFNKTLDKNLNEVLSKSTDLTQKQQKSVDETKRKLDDFQNKIKSVEKTIQELDFQEEIKTLNARLDRIISDLNKTRDGLAIQIEKSFKEILEHHKSNQKQQLLATIGIGIIIIISVLIF